MMDKRDIFDAVQRHASELRGYGVKRLELFGSYAGDTAGEDSDVDFLVEFNDGRGGFDDYIQSLRLLKDILGRDVDLVKKSLVKESYEDSVLGGSRVQAKL
jgi:predicted nucleotidyltransferase